MITSDAKTLAVLLPASDGHLHLPCSAQLFLPNVLLLRWYDVQRLVWRMLVQRLAHLVISGGSTDVGVHIEYSALLHPMLDGLQDVR